MSDRNDKQFVQHSIDTGLANLQGNPFLAQRIMNQERTEQPVMKKKISFAFILAIILLLACAATAAAGAFNEDFNTWLYRIWPEAAKTLMPVNMSCTEGGIRMEVISAVSEGSEVYVTYSIQDLEEDRITPDTEAVIDAQSGTVSTSFSQTAEPLYQPDDKTMVFGQRIRLDSSLQEHPTLQFSINSISPVRTENIDLMPLYKQYASEAKTIPVPENAEAFRNGTPDEISRSGPAGSSDPASLSEEELAFLCYANGQDAEEHLRFIRIHLQPVEGPDGGIAQIAEYEGGGDLHQVGDLEPAAQNGRLDEDEHDVHHPRQGPDGEETPLEIHDGGRAGNGSRTQIGFQGEGHADSHENQSEAGNGIALQEIFGFGFHRFDNFRICRQATSAGLRSWPVRFHRLWP